MKKRNILLLIILCIISLSVLTGLLIFAFQLQIKKDSANNQSTPHITVSPSGANASPAPTVISPSVVSPTPVPGQAGTSATPSPSPTPAVALKEPIVLGFAGDVNLDEDNPPAKKYDSAGKGILGLLSEDLLAQMKAVDIMMLNNEFAYSTRGTKTPDKSYTFRADPGRVNILKDMGVDIVSLANNHALDYGTDALMDTFDTLEQAGIEYAGAGENLDRAKAPIYFEAGGRKIAFIAASRVIFAGSWYATDTSAGMVGTYDPALILESVKEAKENSDFVVIFVHWGIERENYPVDYQKKLAKQYIDAGADAVIGCHPHVMQGIEFYKGKPIAYSLGNFIFTSRTNKSGFLKLYLDADGNVKLQLLPAVYSDTYTYLLTDQEEKADYYDFIREISFDVSIDEDGYITQAE